MNNCCKFQLEEIDLSKNKIESVYENDFNFSLRLVRINLNENRIKFLHVNGFINLKYLESLKFAHNSLGEFSVAWLNCEYLRDLDLSFTTKFFFNNR